MNSTEDMVHHRSSCLCVSACHIVCVTGAMFVCECMLHGSVTDAMFQESCVKSHVSRIMCQESCVKNHVSRVKRQESRV